MSELKLPALVLKATLHPTDTEKTMCGVDVLINGENAERTASIYCAIALSVLKSLSAELAHNHKISEEAALAMIKEKMEEGDHPYRGYAERLSE